MRVSGPWVCMISAATPSDPEPDRGRSNAIGRTSAGMPKRAVTGPAAATTASMPPAARNMPTATRIATRYGMMRRATSKPCFAPSTSES